MASTYGGSFVMRLDANTDLQLGHIIVKVKEKITNYPKSRCVEDLIRIASKNREDSIKKILELYVNEIKESEVK